MKYLIILEPTETGFSAYSPDIPGCIATGATETETKMLMAEAISFHLEGIAQSGAELPVSHSIADYVEIAE
ncbi:MAG: type II toxin-antitoxin system HicB family antitoxin [Methylomonas sp.]|jgi:predicted RNase H-like HicB family nuclease